MVRGNIALLAISLILFQEIASIELLANYKYWNSASNQLTYDYSGNSRHGNLSVNCIVTDRGLSIYPAANTFYFLTLMHYKYPILNEYVVSLWLFSTAGNGGLNFTFYSNAGSIEFKYRFTLNNNILEIEKDKVAYISKTTTIPMFLGWNLNTLRFKRDSNIVGRANFELYRNLVISHSTYLDNVEAYLNMKFIHLGIYESGSGPKFILYEIWLHTGFGNISDLSSLHSSSSTCGCAYDCPTSPTVLCLSSYDSTMNRRGDLCSTGCTSNNLSCDSSLKCIDKNKSVCQQGLYDIITLECLFYCPNNSCACQDVFVSGRTLSCNCNAGYKKISDDPPACISIRCLEYSRVGYSYSCDIAESGYILDNLGEPIQCIPSFTQASSNPLICINTSICIGYTISGGDYICSSCAVGYSIDIQGKCNECNSNYVKVNHNPFTCVIKIDNCDNYIYDGINLICLECIKGYMLDIYGKCSGCTPGYYKASEIECIPLNCLAYITEENQYFCTECSVGYQIDFEGRCSICDANYARVSEEPLICSPKIENCSAYEFASNEYLCKECKTGYKLSSSGYCDECQDKYGKVDSESLLCKPDISNCQGYEETLEGLKCVHCEEGYRIDANHECSLCDIGNINLPQDDLTCIREVQQCSEYGIYNNRWVCISCVIGYEIDNKFECTICAPGYTYSGFKCILQTESKYEDQDSSVSSNQETLTESFNSISFTTVSASTLVASMVSMDSNTLILYINTIQLISFIQYLNIPLPLEIKKQQSSTNKYMKNINILSQIKIQGNDISQYLESSLDDQHSFLAHSIYNLIVFVGILVVNCSIYLLSRYTRGKLKDITSKVLKYFKFTIYIQFYMIGYLDVCYTAIYKLINVKST
jgi:hypothetical protein